MIESFSDLIPYYSWLYIPVALLTVLSAVEYRRNGSLFCSRREKTVSLIFGAAFVLFYASGLVLSSGAFLTGKSITFILISCCLFSAAIGIAYHYVNLFLEKQFEVKEGSEYWLSRYPLIFSSLIMMVCWLPVFLALYPGLFAYDVANQIPQTVGHSNTNHALLHTYYLKAFYNLGREIGSYNTGMAASVIVQMLIFALSLAYSIQYLVQRHVRKVLVIGVLIFFSIVPIFPILAVSMTKDILFTAAFIASFVKILELNENGFQSYRIWDWAEILVFFVLTAMLRNNGQYAVFAVLAAFFVKSLFNRKNIKYAYVLAVTTVLLISVSNNVLMAVTKAVPGTKNQTLSLPYQQLSRVYKYDHAVFSKEDEASVKRLIPKAGHYNEHRSDAVMWSATVFNSRENQKLFARIYFEYLLKKPLRYVEAFLINTSGFWYLDDISSSQMYGKLPHGIRDDFGLFLMDTKPGFGVTHESKLQWLDDLIKALFHENKYQNFPVIASIFNMGTYFWLLVLSVFYCIQVKNNKAIVPLFFVLAYTATLFAGPCALFRYALPFIVCIPAFWVTVYSKKLPQTSSNPSAAA